MLRDAGWIVNFKHVERIWRRRQVYVVCATARGAEGSTQQPKRGRLWPNDGSCVRLRFEHQNHVWSYDFVEDRTHDGRKYRILNIVDEFTRGCLAIRSRTISMSAARPKNYEMAVYDFGRNQNTYSQIAYQLLAVAKFA